MLLHKKGNVADLGNYRPVSLLSAFYKLFMRTVLLRIERTLDETIDRRQAGFRKKLSTTHHVFTLCQLIERSHEYNMPLHICFVDYRKAFDSISFSSIWESLSATGVHPDIVRLLSSFYCTAQSFISVNESKVPVKIEKGVRQGCSLSPQLFNLVVNKVLLAMDWDPLGLNVNGTSVSWFAYADDIVLISPSERGLNRMLADLVRESALVGLHINYDKTVAMSNAPAPPNIMVANHRINVVRFFNYLGVQICIPLDFDTTLGQRISSAWNAFHKYRKIFGSRNVTIHQKSRLFKCVVTPCFTYGAETWSLTQSQRHRLEVELRKMQRRILGISIYDHWTKERLSRVTKIPPINKAATYRKWNFARRLCTYDTASTAASVMNWRPYNNSRSRGRPRLRWRDEFRENLGERWQRTARDDPLQWRQLCHRRWVDTTV